jgi:copper homeostasis protein CutC
MIKEACAETFKEAKLAEERGVDRIEIFRVRKWWINSFR